MHHDGMHFFPLPAGQTGSTHGLLAINHEYTDDGLLHPDGMLTWTAEKVRKSQAAHGISVIEVRMDGGRWRVIRPSRYARRITAATPIGITGPAAGHRVDADRRRSGRPHRARHVQQLRDGLHAVGHLSDLRGELPVLLRQPLRPRARAASSATASPRDGGGYRWHEFDERFDAARHPNEPNRFGWVVEIDPFDPSRPPVKRTALGRFKHEGAALRGRAGPSRGVLHGRRRALRVHLQVRQPRPGPPRTPCDHGTLYAARFDADGTGGWLALAQGQSGLDAGAGFPTQAEVCIDAAPGRGRRGRDQDGPPGVDRGAPDDRRGLLHAHQQRDAGPGRAARAPDAANPRATTCSATSSAGGSAAAIRPRPASTGTSSSWAAIPRAKGDTFGSPDGLWVDGRGVLWIQTDVSTRLLHKGDYAGLGNNQMLAADPGTREVRRFLTGPSGCEVTGATGTPDGRTMFVNIQHPGETPSERSDPATPKGISSWPDGPGGGRPRSATVVIRRADGGLIGT